MSLSYCKSDCISVNKEIVVVFANANEKNQSHVAVWTGEAICRLLAGTELTATFPRAPDE